MWKHIELDRHYIGTFDIEGEKLQGEVLYNKGTGTTVLNIKKELHEINSFGKVYGDIETITGTLNSGEKVTLIDNHCIKNATKVFNSQHLQFVCNYMIWGNKSCENLSFNKMTCVLENALVWSEMSPFYEDKEKGLKLKDSFPEKRFRWFDSDITFSTYTNTMLFVPREEETKIEQRLVMKIEKESAESLNRFIEIREKVLSLMSFAIKDNVNIFEQYLENNDDVYEVKEGIKNNYRYYLFTEDPIKNKIGTYDWDYNFKLSQLENRDLSEEFEKLSPIFNLYLSLFKYKDMPDEMVFLNIVQALETFHSRFFYDDDKEKFIQSVEERFSNCIDYPLIKKLLLNSTQMDENIKYIILVSRINDLLIGKYDGTFYEYYRTDGQYAQKIVDTRHYYTHYGKAKEKKALKGKDLTDAIYVMKLLLEYNICLVLGIDNNKYIREQLSMIRTKKEINKTKN